MTSFTKLNLVSNDQEGPLLNQLREIFFESSDRKNFADEQEKNDFFGTWAGYYLERCRPQVHLATSGDTLLGYLTGCFDSKKAGPYYSSRLKSYDLFSDLFDEYPAHLHINCSEQSRGRGVGSELILRFKKECESEGLSGLHIVTSPQSKNVNFYTKNGFSHQTERSFGKYPLLFMGLPL